MPDDARLDPLELSQALIRCPSVTPANEGALDVLQDGQVALVEGSDTDHWFYNRSEKPAKVLICDLDNR